VAGATTSAKTIFEDQTAVTAMTADKAVSWTIFGGVDSGVFVIGAATGALTFLDAPDYEVPTDAGANNTYVVTVQATDSGGYTAQQTVTVTVANLDDAPPVITGAQTASVVEGQTAVTVFTADEAVIWAVSGTDGDTFAVDAAGGVTFATAPDYDTPGDADGDNVYQMTITATDAAGNMSSQALIVVVTEFSAGDTTPPVMSGPLTPSVLEGQTAVASYTADEVVTWSLSGTDGDTFAVDAAGGVTFVTAPDYDAPADADGDNIYQMTITATDVAGNMSSLALIVTVTEVILADTTPPVITGPSGTGQAQSATVVDGETAVTTFTADEMVAWSGDGGDGGALFAVDVGTGDLSFITSAVFATPTDADSNNVYLVTITATDIAGNRGSQTLAVTVAAPADTTQPAISGPAGGTTDVTAGQTIVTTFTSDEAVVWSIIGADAAVFSIDAAGALTFVVAPDTDAPGDADGDNVYLVTVVATDAAGNTSQQALIVTVTAVIVPDTTPPVITGPAGGRASMAEEQTVVAGFRTDEAVVWTIDGDDAGAFAVDAAGALTFVTSPDADAPSDADGDNVYLVTVVATDDAGNISTQSLTVTVIGVIGPDTTPPDILGQAEQSIGLPEGQMSIINLRADEAVSWSITGGRDQTSMTIDPATGAVRFVRSPDHGAPADADGDNIYVIRVTATDAAGNASTVTLAVVVLDTDDAVAEVFDRYADDVVQIVETVEVNHLRSSVTLLFDMTAAARDRFISAPRVRDGCQGTDDPASMGGRVACSSIATRNHIPFGVHGQILVDANGGFAAGAFFGQTGNYAGTRRKIIEGVYSFIDDGAGITTIDMTGRIAWEHVIADRVMLGYFIGGSFAQTDINARLTGGANKISLSMGTYFVAELQPDLYLDGCLSIAASRNMLALRNADIQLDGAYEAQSLLMGWALSGVMAGDG
jgi:Bacterial Ig-like domain